jgi:hypothetical protein
MMISTKKKRKESICGVWGEEFTRTQHIYAALWTGQRGGGYCKNIKGEM